MMRRNFFAIGMTIIGTAVLGTLSFNAVSFRKIFYKILNRINPPSGPRPDGEREWAAFPSEGMMTSVETALNSRCTSDFDDNPYLFHWGMFDKDKKLTSGQVRQIMAYAEIPRFTDSAIAVTENNGMLTFTIPSNADHSLRDWLMIESGMQQQAIGLVCAAQGAGYVFHTLGVEGQQLPDGSFATVRIQVDAMKPSYKNSFWSSAEPGKLCLGKSGSLSAPQRQGTKPLIAMLNGLKTSSDTGRKANASDIGQLLWAARGRTPHYYKSVPWGMTIPTYQGNNKISEVLLVNEGFILRYVNWKENRPAHSLEQIGTIPTVLSESFAKQNGLPDRLIVLRKNETMARALWEIGYQLINILVQARALEINYKAILLDENQKQFLITAGIYDPVALLAV